VPCTSLLMIRNMKSMRNRFCHKRVFPM
jgi:hypothetical protein